MISDVLEEEHPTPRTMRAISDVNMDGARQIVVADFTGGRDSGLECIEASQLIRAPPGFVHRMRQ